MRSVHGCVIAVAVAVALFQGIAAADDVPVDPTATTSVPAGPPATAAPTPDAPPTDAPPTEAPPADPATTVPPSDSAVVVPAPAAPDAPAPVPGPADTSSPAAVVPATSGTAPATMAPLKAALSAFSSCTEAKAAGYTNMRRGQPGYSVLLDGDGDGVACEDTSVAAVTSTTSPLVPIPSELPTTVPAQVAGATAEAPAAPSASVAGQSTFANCAEAKASGASNIPRSSPYYSEALDANHNGIACEASESSVSSATVGLGSLPLTGTAVAGLSLLAAALTLLGLLLVLAGARLRRARPIVIHSKTGAILLVPQARRFR